MKVAIVLCFIAVVGCASAFSEPKPEENPRGCIYVGGRCVQQFQQCEVGTYAYSSACGYKMPEPTCRNKNPVEDTAGGNLCDFTACYCDPPTVRDELSGKCIHHLQCPQY